MSTLISEISLEDFKKLNASELKRLKCCEVFDGEYLFTFIRPQTEYIRMQSENFGQLSNSVGGETLEQIRQTNEPEEYIAEHTYKSKRKKRKVKI
jgi:hypothetical protein